MSKYDLNVESLLLHGGYEFEKNYGARAVPIFQTSSFQFESSDHASDLFLLKEKGNIYTRLQNPTTEVFENRMTALENGIGALATASGQAAVSFALLNIAQAGDEIVATRNLYGGSFTLLKYLFKRFGVTVRFIPPNDFEALKAAIHSKTKAVYTESIGNPGLNVADIEQYADIAHKNGIPLIVDNTVAPYLLKPVQHGADIVVYSATKFIGGHGNSIGGVIVDSGRFQWSREKFPLIAGPDESYHHMDFVETFKSQGNIAYITKARVSLMRNLGACLSPFNAFLFLQGLETSPENARAKKYLQNQGGAIIGFGIQGGREAGKKCIDGLQMICHLANIGDTRTLAIHPASTTHSRLTEQEQQNAGISPNFIRLSIGLEHPDDIIYDLKQALKQSLEP